MRRIVRKATVISVDFNGELILLSLDKNTYFGSRSVGAEIIKFIGEPRAISEVLAYLFQLYTVDPLDCESDVEDFLRNCHSAGIVEWVE